MCWRVGLGLDPTAVPICHQRTCLCLVQLLLQAGASAYDTTVITVSPHCSAQPSLA